MEVDDDDIRVYFFQNSLGCQEGVIEVRVHILLTHQVYDSYGGKAHVYGAEALAGGSGRRIIRRTDDKGILVEEREDFFTAEAVVAEGYHIGA